MRDRDAGRFGVSCARSDRKQGPDLAQQRPWVVRRRRGRALDSASTSRHGSWPSPQAWLCSTPAKCRYPRCSRPLIITPTMRLACPAGAAAPAGPPSMKPRWDMPVGVLAHRRGPSGCGEAVGLAASGRSCMSLCASRGGMLAWTRGARSAPAASIQRAAFRRSCNWLGFEGPVFRSVGIDAGGGVAFEALKDNPKALTAAASFQSPEKQPFLLFRGCMQRSATK